MLIRRDDLLEELRDPRALSMDATYVLGKRGGVEEVTLSWKQMPVLVYRDEDKDWIAKCLPFNQAGVGGTLSDALESLAEALGEILLDAVENNYILQLINDVKSGVGRPSEGYWKEYAKAARVTSLQRRRLAEFRTDRFSLAAYNQPVERSLLRKMCAAHVAI